MNIFKDTMSEMTYFSNRRSHKECKPEIRVTGLLDGVRI